MGDYQVLFFIVLLVVSYMRALTPIARSSHI